MFLYYIDLFRAHHNNAMHTMIVWFVCLIFHTCCILDTPLHTRFALIYCSCILFKLQLNMIISIHYNVKSINNFLNNRFLFQNHHHICIWNHHDICIWNTQYNALIQLKMIISYAIVIFNQILKTKYCFINYRIL